MNTHSQDRSVRPLAYGLVVVGRDAGTSVLDLNRLKSVYLEADLWLDPQIVLWMTYRMMTTTTTTTTYQWT